jgi:hypothetical protein
MHRMEQIYGEYCKKHEDAVCKLQELSSRPLVQSFLSVCNCYTRNTDNNMYTDLYQSRSVKIKCREEQRVGIYLVC